jgi:hypothetical protein
MRERAKCAFASLSLGKRYETGIVLTMGGTEWACTRLIVRRVVTTTRIRRGRRRKARIVGILRRSARSIVRSARVVAPRIRRFSRDPCIVAVRIRRSGGRVGTLEWSR